MSQIEEGKPFIFTAEVALKPEVTLGAYKGIEVEKADVTVTDEEIDADLQQQRENNARTVTVEGRPVQDGDTAVIDYEGFVEALRLKAAKGKTTTWSSVPIPLSTLSRSSSSGKTQGSPAR